MTSREFSEVDHDLLADYLGGALDGTPEQATVARLVEQDPAWRVAYETLAEAVDLVHADLAGWTAAPAPQMPVAVTDRITAALAGAGPAPGPAAPRDGTPVVPAQAGGTSRPPGAASRPERHSGPGRRPRRWARIAGPVALAAASVAAVGLGVGRLAGPGDGGTADRAAPMAAAPYRTTGPALSSGTDWTPERLAADRVPAGAKSMPQPDMAGPSGAGRENGPETPLASDRYRVGVVLDLERLARPEALAACLTAIGAEHGDTPLTVSMIDYARYQGVPALVVTFADATGARWGWASGPECGVPGSGADTRFRTRVG
ncbi:MULTISPECIES: hypothetical protein [unclassified Micromonospora]|uniref:hypothetical protein n=1 Tax=unclassified Micromonospora TaxID=2617518 RepID=UPI001B359335|nr:MULTISPECIES: hypothetical protein [unclassified Micromonospora]MBQ1043928.1 hypothetical protein [Micromonospora sp. C72]MBQ1054781.1 hypothetical protein [Micromonospora sp. C32]